jgi:hypothetical protein
VQKKVHVKWRAHRRTQSACTSRDKELVASEFGEGAGGVD